MKIGLALAALCAVSLLEAPASWRATAAPSRTEVLWDTYGVPHVFASDVPALFRAFGWAQMAGHGNLILRLYGEARGRAAEYWGEAHLASDRWVRMNGVPERAEAWERLQSGRFRQYLDAFARGMNEYAARHPEAVDETVKVVLPVRAADVLAHVQRVVYFTFLAGSGLLNGISEADPTMGSNGWAIAPARSANGHAMLLANPHLPWSGLFTFVEAQLTGPGIDAYGAALVGFPVLGIAFNDHLGWTHTVNPIDAVDLYALEPAGAGSGYVFENGPRAFEVREQTLKVRREGGRMESVPLVVRRSVHGVVLGQQDGRPVALRVAALDQAGLCEQWWDMARARSVGEFESALRRLQIPMFNVIYADRAGHILYVFNGQVPVRTGAYEWRGIVPGRLSETLWTRTHPYGDLPRAKDPPTGWLQNANDPPWTSTWPSGLDRRDFPAYMAPGGMGLRAQRGARLLMSDRRIGFDELVRYKHSTHVELADRILDDTIRAARGAGDAALRAAADVLAAWDRTTDGASRGAVLFQRFAAQWLERGGRFRVPWDERQPLDTPSGIGDLPGALAELTSAAAWVSERYGSLDVAWGDVYRLRRDGADLPANGYGDAFGAVRVVGYEPAADGKFAAASGDGYIAIVEFSTPVRAQALLGYGNSSQPGSRHRTDQLRFVSTKTLRPVWRRHADVARHLQARDVF